MCTLVLPVMHELRFVFYLAYSFDYTMRMFTVKSLPEFSEWIDGLKDSVTCIRLAHRLDKVSRGQLGDVKPVGDGVFELRDTSARAGACITSSADRY